MILVHLTKALPRNPLFEFASRQALAAYYKEYPIIGKLDDEALLDLLSKLFTLKHVELDELQHRTYFGEMILGPRKPDVYTDLWEVEEDERSRFFYDYRRRILPQMDFDMVGRIVIFHAPTHPLDNELPVSHFASNCELFNAFVNYIRGIDKSSLIEGGTEAGFYFMNFQTLDTLLTEEFGFGKTIKLIDSPVFDGRIGNNEHPTMT